MLRSIIYLVLFTLFLASPVLAADVVLVVNVANPVTSLDSKSAKQIFLGKKGAWDNGDKIVLYSQNDPQITDSFSRKVLNKSAQQFNTFWKKALFTGTGRPPIEVQNDAQMKQSIAADPRGIGYISSAALDGSVKAVTFR